MNNHQLNINNKVASEEVVSNRKVAHGLVRDLGARGNTLCTELLALEGLASPFYLGLDQDPDETDLDVFP